MLTYYILPGGDGTNNYGWFNWLKKEIEEKALGTAIICETEIISPIERAKLLASQYILDHNTVIVSHSFGALAAIKWVEIVGRHIAGLVLIDPSVKISFEAPWVEELAAEDHNRLLYLESWNWEMELPIVKRYVDKIIILSDQHPESIINNRWPGEHANYAKELGALLIETTGEEMHFYAEQEPEVLKAVMKITLDKNSSK